MPIRILMILSTLLVTSISSAKDDSKNLIACFFQNENRSVQIVENVKPGAQSRYLITFRQGREEGTGSYGQSHVYLRANEMTVARNANGEISQVTVNMPTTIQNSFLPPVGFFNIDSDSGNLKVNSDYFGLTIDAPVICKEEIPADLFRPRQSNEQDPRLDMKQ